MDGVVLPHGLQRPQPAVSHRSQDGTGNTVWAAHGGTDHEGSAGGPDDTRLPKWCPSRCHRDLPNAVVTIRAPATSENLTLLMKTRIPTMMHDCAESRRLQVVPPVAIGTLISSRMPIPL